MAKLISKSLLFSVYIVLTCFFTNSVHAQDDVIFSGKIIDPNSDQVTISSKTFKKQISLNEDDTFSATFKIDKPGFYTFNDGKEVAQVYLENGYNLKLALDTKEFDETIKLEGKGADLNNFFFEKYLDEESKIFPRLSVVDSAQFKVLVDSILTTYATQLEVLDLSKSELEAGLNQVKSKERTFKSQFSYTQVMKSLEKFKGQVLDDFEFSTIDGDRFKTKDLIGKPTYIDVWATWCGPCIGEIPALKELEKEYGDQIQFLSISVDTKKQKPIWKKMVEEKELEGIQVIADNAWKSDFVKAYKIMGIPRFMLIDSNGIIVSANAPRPSSGEEIKAELNKLIK